MSQSCRLGKTCDPHNPRITLHSPPHDARRSNGAPNHPPGCTCPFHAAARFPHRIEVRLTQEDWDAMNAAADGMGMSRSEILRLGLSRLVECALAPMAKQRRRDTHRREHGKRLLREGWTRGRVAQLLGVEWSTAHYWWKQVQKEEGRTS